MRVVLNAGLDQLVSPVEVVARQILLTAGSADATASIYGGDPTAHASAAAAVAGGGNVGNGTVGSETVSDIYTKTETWTLTCLIGGGAGVGTFSVVGSVTGARGNAVVGTLYHSNSVNPGNSEINFLISAGSTPFVAGDSFTIATTRATYGTELQLAAKAGTIARWALPVSHGGDGGRFPGPVTADVVGTGSFLRVDA